jgi:hypothetical protein
MNTLRDEDFPAPGYAELHYYDNPDDESGLVQKFVNRVTRERLAQMNRTLPGGMRIGVGRCGVYCCYRHTYEAKDEPPCHTPTIGEFRQMTGIPYRDETVYHTPGVVV